MNFGSRDPDRRSYSCEHDASRLSLSIMWQVLQRPGIAPRVPPWFRYMCMAFELNHAEHYSAVIRRQGSDGEVWAAYR